MNADRSQENAPAVSVLLVGPYDPHCGEYTFLAPPLGVWRLKGVLCEAGVAAEVFDPNCCDEAPEKAFAKILERQRWSVVGISTTGMTLQFDLALAHQARQALPGAVLVAGGMEATFKPSLMFDLGPFDLVALGEGEKPLIELADRLSKNQPFSGITGTAYPDASGEVIRRPQIALEPDELDEAIFATPYEEMPYRAYWDRLESSYKVAALPVKADREARLAEVRSVRLNTLNYCPMGCTFCSSTNFLHAAQGSYARIRRLEADGCLEMMKRIVAAHPDVKTIIFQDDIFVFTNDSRILPLCESIVAAKQNGELPAELQFISTNRIDAMTDERLTAMSNAGFRVLGFGIESFSQEILKEFNKAQIFTHIEPMLSKALDLGITPFLDLILTSPRCSVDDLAENLRQAYRWLLAGCEMGMYPYIIPFSGAAMAEDETLAPYTISSERRVAGTTISWQQPTKILPADELVRWAILEIESSYEGWMSMLQEHVAHLPSRVRSLVWILASIPILESIDISAAAPANEVAEQLIIRLPKDAELETRILSLMERPFRREESVAEVGGIAG